MSGTLNETAADPHNTDLVYERNEVILGGEHHDVRTPNVSSEDQNPTIAEDDNQTKPAANKMKNTFVPIMGADVMREMMKKNIVKSSHTDQEIKETVGEGALQNNVAVEVEPIKQEQSIEPVKVEDTVVTSVQNDNVLSERDISAPQVVQQVESISYQTTPQVMTVSEPQTVTTANQVEPTVLQTMAPVTVTEKVVVEENVIPAATLNTSTEFINVVESKPILTEQTSTIVEPTVIDSVVEQNPNKLIRSGSVTKNKEFMSELNNRLSIKPQTLSEKRQSAELREAVFTPDNVRQEREEHIRTMESDSELRKLQMMQREREMASAPSPVVPQASETVAVQQLPKHMDPILVDPVHNVVKIPSPLVEAPRKKKVTPRSPMSPAGGKKKKKGAWGKFKELFKKKDKSGKVKSPKPTQTEVVAETTTTIVTTTN